MKDFPHETFPIQMSPIFFWKITPLNQQRKKWIARLRSKFLPGEITSLLDNFLFDNSPAWQIIQKISKLGKDLAV